MTGNPEAVALYLDLIKRVLTDSIFLDDPLAHCIPHQIRPDTNWFKRLVLGALTTGLSRYQIKLVEHHGIASVAERAKAREVGSDWPTRAHSMIGLKRLNNLQYCIETVLKDNVPGDFIETGVWRGGACILMRAALKAYGVSDRTVWLADSFAGLPPPASDKYSADIDDPHHTFTFLRVSQEDVQKNFQRYDLLDEQVRFLKGWFSDTLPTAPVERLAILRLDGDMYESTIQAIEALYDRLSPGGYVIVDDYFLQPCAQAIHDFRDARGITDPIIDIDGLGSYWRRSA